MLAIVSCVQAQAADKVTYQLDWLPGGDKAPIYVCIEQGFCADAGLDVTIASGRGSSEAITRLATGASDIGSAGLGALMAAKSTENVGVTAVMSLFSQGPHAFYTLKGSGIESVSDVKGLRIATSPFTSSNVFLPLVLREVGLSESDITLTKAEPGALGPMLMTGAADAIIAWMTDVSRYTNQAKEAGKEIVILPWSDAGLELYSASLIASDRFLSERPDVAQRFIQAFRKSVEFTRDEPQAAAASVAAQVPELSAEDVIGSVNDVLGLIFNEITDAEGLGAFDKDRLAATWVRVSESQGLALDSIDPESIVDRSYLPGS